MMEKAYSLGVDEVRPAVLTIDMHRGHLDPGFATVPLGEPYATQVTNACNGFLQKVRVAGVPIVHVTTMSRDSTEIETNPFWRAQTWGNPPASSPWYATRRHNLQGSPGTEFIPGIVCNDDKVVEAKKRYDCFLHTDLAFVLQTLRVNTLVITGIFTNRCVLATTIVASTRDYACVVVSDCVASSDDDLHGQALRIIAKAFGWVLQSNEVLSILP